jgi:hypothetical protein
MSVCYTVYAGNLYDIAVVCTLDIDVLEHGLRCIDAFNVSMRCIIQVRRTSETAGPYIQKTRRVSI